MPVFKQETIHHNPERQKIVELLTAKAWATVNHNYGRFGEKPKPYHGPEHTVYVTRAANMLGDLAVINGSITEQQLDILLLAAAYHDVVHEGAQDDEARSAQLAVEEVSSTNLFSDDEIVELHEAIMATKVVEETENRIIQSANGSYVGRLMADADLHSFGSPWDIFWPSTQRYFAEKFPDNKPYGKIFCDFVRRQQIVVGEHLYHTREANLILSHQWANEIMIGKIITE